MTTKITMAVLSAALLSACTPASLPSVEPQGMPPSQPMAHRSASPLGAYLQGAIADVRGDELRAAKAYSLSMEDGAAIHLPTAMHMRALEKYLLQDDVPAAIRIAKTSADEKGDALMQWMTLMVHGAKKNDRKAVRAHLRKAQEHLPELVQLHLIDAYLQLRAGVSRKTAMKGLKNADITTGYLARLTYHKARMAVIEGDTDTAIDLLTDAQKLEEGALFTSRLLGRLHHAAGNTDKASAALSEFRTKHASALLLADVADADFLTAEEERTESSLADDMAETLFGLSVLLWAQGADVPARQFMALALHLDGTDMYKRYYAGVLAESAGQLDLALGYYKDIAKTPGLTLASFSRQGATYKTLGKVDKAITILTRAHTQAPQNQAILSQLAAFHEEAGHYKEAVALYTQLIESFTEDTTDAQKAQTFFARGAAYERQQNYKAATADMQKALTITPDEPMILNYLGYMWVDADMRVEEGFDLLKKAHKLAPRSPAVLDSLGWAHYKLNAYAQALLYISRAVDLQPEDPILQDHLGDVYHALGNPTNAQKHWRLALELASRSESPDLNVDTLKKKLEK